MLVDVDDLIRIRNKHIVGWSHTDQMRKLIGEAVEVLILLVHIVSDLTGAHCAQQGRPSGLAPAQPRRSSQRVLHC